MPRPLSRCHRLNLWASIMGDSMEPLVLPEIKHKMKVLITIASKKIITPFVIEVSEIPISLKLPSHNHTEISSKISIGCDIFLQK